MFQRNEKLLTKCYTSKKEKTTDKVSCLKQQNKTETLLTKCYASTIYIHNHEIQKKKKKKKRNYLLTFRSFIQVWSSKRISS